MDQESESSNFNDNTQRSNLQSRNKINHMNLNENKTYQNFNRLNFSHYGFNRDLISRNNLSKRIKTSDQINSHRRICDIARERSQEEFELIMQNPVKLQNHILLSKILLDKDEQESQFDSNTQSKLTFSQPRTSDITKPGNINVARDFMGSLYSDQGWSKIASDQQFDKVITMLSDFYGMKLNSNESNRYESDPRFIHTLKKFQKIFLKKFKSPIKDRTLITPQPFHNNDMINDQLSKTETIQDQSLEDQKLFDKYFNSGQEEQIESRLKDQQIIKRYSKFLNKCMFIAQDDFIKKKFKAFMNIGKKDKGDNFYERMAKDAKARQEKAEKNTSNNMRSTFLNQRSTFDKLSSRGSENDGMSFRQGILKRQINDSFEINQPNRQVHNNLGFQTQITIREETEQDDPRFKLVDKIESHQPIKLQPDDFFNQQRSKSNTTFTSQKVSAFTNEKKSDMARRLLFADMNFERIEEERGTYESFKKSRPSRCQNQQQMNGQEIIDMKIQDLEFKIMTKKRKDKIQQFQTRKESSQIL